MRRLFIMRKDLLMSTGKLLAQVMHCAEAYWTRQLSHGEVHADDEEGVYEISVRIQKHIIDEYVCGTFTKTVCQAKNKRDLLKAKAIANGMGLLEDIDYGLIYDKCLTELEPEEENGTTLTGIWFCPLSDEQSHEISKKYHLYVG